MKKTMPRCEVFARYIIDNQTTIREAAKHFSYSKSTVHNDVSKKLKKTNFPLYKKLKKILENNFSEKHIRGGMATKNKFKNIKKINKK